LIRFEKPVHYDVRLPSVDGLQLFPDLKLTDEKYEAIAARRTVLLMQTRCLDDHPRSLAKSRNTPIEAFIPSLLKSTQNYLIHFENPGRYPGGNETVTQGGGRFGARCSFQPSWIVSGRR